jgi:hypothetical protein
VPITLGRTWTQQLGAAVWIITGAIVPVLWGAAIGLDATLVLLALVVVGVGLAAV